MKNGWPFLSCNEHIIWKYKYVWLPANALSTPTHLIQYQITYKLRHMSITHQVCLVFLGFLLLVILKVATRRVFHGTSRICRTNLNVPQGLATSRILIIKYVLMKIWLQRWATFSPWFLSFLAFLIQIAIHRDKCTWDTNVIKTEVLAKFNYDYLFLKACQITKTIAACNKACNNVSIKST